MEPPWSPPKEMSTSRAATAAAEPEDDPPHVIVVVGVEGPAVVANGTTCAEAAAQSVHDVLADDGASLLQNAGDDCRIEVGDEAFEREGAEAHGYTCHSDMILITDGFAGKQTFGCPLDPALPHPGVERVFFWAWPVSGIAVGRDHRRLGLLHPGLDEGVQLSHLFHQVLAVLDGLIGTQVNP